MTLTVDSVFGDHMVLQGGMRLPVRGTADPGARVAMSFAGQRVESTANADGRWVVWLEPLAANASPQTLSVCAAGGSGADTSLELRDILVGEVWVCSGQSNMEWSVSLASNAEAEIAAADFPGIRLLQVPKRVSEQPLRDGALGSWTACTPGTVQGFSAVGYFFGREIHRRLGVPVGLANASWGGTVAEAWTSREGLLGDPALRAVVEDYEGGLSRLGEKRAEWQVCMQAIEERTRDRANEGWPRGWADLPEPDGTWQDMVLPGTWQSRGVNFSGVLWFRRAVDVPAAWAGRDLKLSIGATDKSDVTYFNNVQVGSLTMQERPDAWCFLRSYPVPGTLVKSGRHTIAVRVHSDRYAGGMTGPAAVMQLSCPGLRGAEPIPLAGTWRYAVETSYGQVEIPPMPPGPGDPNSPCALFDGMIAPLLPLPIRGALWYQGESNAGRPRQYRDLFPALIRDWRRHWQQGDFPFLFVQLPNYGGAAAEPGPSAWAELREAQALALRLPGTGMAVTIDVGEAADIHPPHKQVVGLRLALNALATVYGRDEVVPSGPVLRRAWRENGAFLLEFEHVDGGLECRGEELQGFAVAGNDRRFVWAQARIEGEAVRVWAPAVADPQSVRYAWADNPLCNLYNRAGLPAAPFRTDDWS